MTKFIIFFTILLAGCYVSQCLGSSAEKQIKSQHQVEQYLTDVKRQTTTVFAEKERYLLNKSYPVSKVIIPNDGFNLLDSISSRIKSGDTRYVIELLDGDENQEFISLSFNESSGVELSGESYGLLLRIDQNTRQLQALFNLAIRPHPYDGVCVPHIWISTPTMLHGWLAEGAQPCRYYPVSIDLEKLEFRFLSNSFQYNTEVFNIDNSRKISM